ncbi:MAG: hypothetical protein ABI855_19825, partial [Bacteroidota bacterium]
MSENQISENTIEKRIIEEKGFDFKQFFFKYVLSFWYLYIITLSLSFVIAYYYNWYTTPIYKSTSSLLINNKKNGSDLLAQMATYYDEGGLENEIVILNSRAIISKVIQELDFEVSYYLRGNFKTTEMYKESPIQLDNISLNYKSYAAPIDIHILNSKKFSIKYHSSKDEEVTERHSFGEVIKDQLGTFSITKRGNFNDSLFDKPDYDKKNFIIRINTLDHLIDAYGGRLEVEPINKKTTILQLSITDAVPQKASDFLNKLMDVYIRNGIEQKNELARNSLKFIDDQLLLLYQALDTSE